MFLTQRKNGYWYIGLTRNKKRVFVSCKTKSKTAANEIFREYNPAIKTNKDIFDIERLALEYAEANVSKKTYSQYVNTLALVTAKFKDSKIGEITKTDIDNFLAIRRKTFKSGTKEYYSKYSLNLEIAIIKKAFGIALEKKWITENPAKKIKKYPVTSERPAFELNEETALLETIRTQTKSIKYYYALEIMFDTGMRKTETCLLKWKQIEFDKMRIKLFNKMTGEGEYAYFSERSLKVFNELKNSNIQSSEGYIYGSKISIRNFNRTFNLYRDKLGYSKKLVPHSTRHTAGTRWANELPFRVAQDLLRHKKPEMTMRYTHTKEKQLREAVNK